MKIQPIENKNFESEQIAVVNTYKSRSYIQAEFGKTSKEMEMEERIQCMEMRIDQIFDSLKKNIKILTWLTSAALVGICILLIMVFLA